MVITLKCSGVQAYSLILESGNSAEEKGGEELRKSS